MHKPALLALAMLVAAGPAFAQSTSRAPRHAAPSGQVPVDHGPFTPDANRAYQGGGVILQGAPGAPPPMPQATPPGQVPQNAVPVR